MMKTTSANNLKGVITALVTPFQNGAVDLKSLAKVLAMQLEQGVQGFVVNGTTGESPTLSPKEVKEVFDFVKAEVGGRVPVIVGTGSNSTRATAEFTKTVSGWGAAAALVVVPYYNRPPQRGLLAHFKAVAAASEIPLILYNVPSRTVAGLEPETVGELSHVDKIVGIKEATGNLGLLAQMQKLADQEFIFLSGDDLSSVDFCAHGGHGVISVSSHLIGKEMIQFIQRQAGAEFRKKYAEFMKWLYIEANPIPVKAALHWQGHLASPELRLPLSTLDEKFHKDFQACLKNLKLL